MKRPLLAACLVGAALAAAAETGGVARLSEPILVTARAVAVPASRTPGGVAVLESGDIRLRPAPGVADLAELVSGVSAAKDGSWGGDVNVRGLARDSVVFLIDGARVNTATDLGARLGLVEPMEIERIEFLKGPIAALYGSGSLGGVVNVVTRTGRFAPAPEWRGGATAAAESNPAGLSGFAFGNWNGPRRFWYASQSWRERGDYEDGAGREVRNSRYADRQTKAQFGERVGEDLEVVGNVHYFEGHEIGIPGSGTAPLPSAADVTYESVRRVLLSALGRWQPAGAGALRDSTLNVYYQAIDRRVRIDQFPAASPVEELRPRGEHETWGAKWVNAAQWAGHAVGAGADVWRRSLESVRYRRLRTGAVREESPLPDASFLSGGVFAEDDWAASERLTLNGGARLDWIRVRNESNPDWPAGEEAEAAGSGHVGATWKLAAALCAKAIVAGGYRAASLEERFQYLELGGGVVRYGDPALDPERSLFAECGLSWVGDRLLLGVSAFQNRLRDLIGERVVDPLTIVNANVDEARIEGLEAEARWQAWQGAQLYGNVAVTKGEDTASGEPLPNIAPLSGLAGIFCGEGRGAWGCVETAFAARQDDVPPGVQEAPAWARVDARAGWTFGPHGVDQTLYAGVRNLLDRDYRNYLTTARGSEFHEPGRSFVAGYEIRF